MGKEERLISKHIFAHFPLSCGYQSKLAFKFAYKFGVKNIFLEVFRQLSSKVFDVKAQLGTHAFYGMGLTFFKCTLISQPFGTLFFDIFSSSSKLFIQF